MKNRNAEDEPIVVTINYGWAASLIPFRPGKLLVLNLYKYHILQNPITQG